MRRDSRVHAEVTLNKHQTRSRLRTKNLKVNRVGFVLKHQIWVNYDKKKIVTTSDLLAPGVKQWVRGTSQVNDEHRALIETYRHTHTHTYW